MRLGIRPAAVIRRQIRAVAGNNVAALARLGVSHRGQEAIEMPNDQIGVIDRGDCAAQSHDDHQRRDAHEQGEHGGGERDGDLLANRHSKGLYTTASTVRKPPLPLAASRELLRHLLPLSDAWRRAVIRSHIAAHRAAALALSLVALSVSVRVGAQRPRPPTGPLRPYTAVGGAALPFDSAAFGAVRWRELGPFRG